MILKTEPEDQPEDEYQESLHGKVYDLLIASGLPPLGLSLELSGCYLCSL